jgi:hypothetical protein
LAQIKEEIMTDEQAEALRVCRRQVGIFHTPAGCDDGSLTRSLAFNADRIPASGPSGGQASAWSVTKPMPKVGARVGELYFRPIWTRRRRSTHVTT